MARCLVPCHGACQSAGSCVWQVVQQARDTVVTDTKLETAIVGEDILLTPRSPDAQPDPQSDALLAAGDNAASRSTHTHTYAVRC